MDRTQLKGKLDAWREGTTARKIIIIAVMMLLVVFLIWFAFQLYGTITQDLSLILKPGEAVLTAEHGESMELEFSIHSNNYLFCEARCSAELIDISDELIIKTYSDFTLRNSNQTLDFELTAPESGEGQKLYSLGVTCNNIQKKLCDRDERNVSASVLIAMNYTLTEEKERIREIFLRDAPILIDLLRESQIYTRNSESLLNHLGQYGNEFNGLGMRFGNVSRNLENLIEYSLILEILWNSSTYKDLGRKQIPLEEARSLLFDANDTFSDIVSYYGEQNRLISLLRNDSFRDYADAANVFRVNGLDWYYEQLEMNLDELTEIGENASARPAHNAFTHLVTLRRNQDQYDAYMDTARNTAEENVADIIKIIENEYKNMNITYNFTPTDDAFGDLKAVCEDIVNLAGNLTTPQACSFNTSLQNHLRNMTFTSLTIPSISSESSLEMDFKIPEPVCCAFGECNTCCNGPDCLETPILFLHGHSMNERNSPQYTLQAFDSIISKLQKEEILMDAGALTLYSGTVDFPRGEWGRSGKRIGVRGTYYYDAYLAGESYITSVSRSENIDTYAIRLKELVDILKYRTGSDEIILVTHSMGGLVARRYLQIFGKSDIENMIMFAPPNHGVRAAVASLCPVFGADRECEDMRSGSIFLSKLNDPARRVYLPTTIIAGTGCDMRGGTGDGIATVESSSLSRTEFHVINGTCDRFADLHSDILNPEKYPGAYEILREELE